MNAQSTTWHLDGSSVRVTNLDKLYWSEDGLTKGDLLTYYREMAPVLLPYCAGRPATLRVFPDGIHGASYYRRDFPRHLGPGLSVVEYRTATDRHVLRAVLIDDSAGLISLANSGAIELHLWSSRLPNLAEPDQVIFDLDPGDQVTFVEVLEVALRLR